MLVSQHRQVAEAGEASLEAWYGWTFIRRRGDPVITRRSVVLAGGASVLVARRLSHGQPTVRRVGWVSLGSMASPAEAYAAF